MANNHTSKFQFVFTGCDTIPTCFNGLNCRIMRHASGHPLLVFRFNILMTMETGVNIMLPKKSVKPNKAYDPKTNQLSIFEN